MSSINEVLGAAGYNDPGVKRYIQADVCILKARINEMRFNNYTWFVPIIPTWGRIEFALRLESRSGILLWEGGLRAVVLICFLGMVITMLLLVQ